MTLGEVIEIKEEDKKAINELNKACDTAFVAFNDATAMRKLSLSKLWDFIKEKYPETNNFELSYDSKNKEIILIGRKQS